jgi:hypothetical protein
MTFRQYRSSYFTRTILLIVCMPSFCVAQNNSDNSSAGANQSWTSTSQQQYPGNVNPGRTSESHTQSGDQTRDHQSIERMGVDGHYEPYLDVQKESVKVDATTVRTIERRFGRDADGRQTLLQVTEEEKRSLPGGEVKTTRSTSNPDANGNLQIAKRELEDTKQVSANVQETKSTLYTPDPNGGLVMSMQTEERQTKINDHDIQFRKSTSLSDSNGGWQLSEIREGTIKDDGKERTKEESVSRPGSDGNLSIVQRTVSKESANSTGEKRDMVETYSTDVPGSAGDGNLRLNQRITTTHRKDAGGQSTEEQVEQRNPGQPGEGLRVTQKTINIVRPGIGGTSRETQTTQSLDANGTLGVVSVNTQKQDNPTEIKVDIAPDKPAKNSKP